MTLRERTGFNLSIQSTNSLAPPRSFLDDDLESIMDQSDNAFR